MTNELIDWREFLRAYLDVKNSMSWEEFITEHLPVEPLPHCGSEGDEGEMKLKAWWHPTDLNLGVGLDLRGRCFYLSLLVGTICLEWGRNLAEEKVEIK